MDAHTPPETNPLLPDLEPFTVFVDDRPVGLVIPSEYGSFIARDSVNESAIFPTALAAAGWVGQRHIANPSTDPCYGLGSVHFPGHSVSVPCPVCFPRS